VITSAGTGRLSVARPPGRGRRERESVLLHGAYAAARRAAQGRLYASAGSDRDAGNCAPAAVDSCHRATLPYRARSVLAAFGSVQGGGLGVRCVLAPRRG
jgi:hypothetical protein